MMTSLMMLLLFIPSIFIVILSTTTTTKTTYIFCCHSFPIDNSIQYRKRTRIQYYDTIQQWSKSNSISSSSSSFNVVASSSSSAFGVDPLASNQRRIQKSSNGNNNNNNDDDDADTTTTTTTTRRRKLYVDNNNNDNSRQQQGRRRQHHRDPVISPRSSRIDIKTTTTTRSYSSSSYSSYSSYSSSQSEQSQSRWERAVQTEGRLQIALDALLLYYERYQKQQQQQHHNHLKIPSGGRGVLDDNNKHHQDQGQRWNNNDSNINDDDDNNNNVSEDIRQIRTILSFPDIRECNAAVATFGDNGDLLRSLRLYFKMRKARTIYDTINNNKSMLLLTSSSSTTTSLPSFVTLPTITATIVVPTPTMVTYSTLMSRAISLGKPKVAIRVWRIVRREPNFFTNYNHHNANNNHPNSSSENDNDDNRHHYHHHHHHHRDDNDILIPDIKAANILMNAYAKMGDLDAAEDLMKQLQTPPPVSTSSTTTNTGKNNNYNRYGGGYDMPYLQPNLVTYNTLLDACHKTGSLDKALLYKEQLVQRMADTSSSSSSSSSKQRDHHYQRRHQHRHRRDGKQQTRPTTPLRPDARTFTTLIATVARSAGQTRGGKHDPSLAFDLLHEMKDVHHIAPNGMTYSALIDVCGRCRRSDLALQGLRWMLLDENVVNKDGKTNNNNTVGAWTSAINACGKAGRVDTAMKLFFDSMPRFNVRPNIVTCGCLTDCLLKYGGDPVKTAEYTLQVLRYMKQNDIPPTEVMYTSLMTYATRLAQQEAQQRRDNNNKNNNNNNDHNTWMTNEERLASYVVGSNKNDKGDDTKAVNIYSELMSTLIGRKKTTMGATTTAAGRGNFNTRSSSSTTTTTTNESSYCANVISHVGRCDDDELFQVSLVFQEMKASGVVPDLACYNVLLRSCANVGNVDKAQQVLQEVLHRNKHHYHHHNNNSNNNHCEPPNNRTWREMLRVAGQAKRSDVLLQTWKMATSAVVGGKYNSDDNRKGNNNNDVDDGVVDEKKDQELVEINSSNDGLAATTSLTTTEDRRGGTSNTAPPKAARLSIETFRALLAGLLKCAWDVRESDRHTSIQLYRLMIKCYKALLSGSDYMGMTNVDRAALEHPQVIASLIQAVVTLEELLSSTAIVSPETNQNGHDGYSKELQGVIEYPTNTVDNDDRRKQPDTAQLVECQKLRRLAASMAMSDCLYDGSSYSPSIGSNKHFVRALQTAKKWAVRNGGPTYRP